MSPSILAETLPLGAGFVLALLLCIRLQQRRAFTHAISRVAGDERKVTIINRILLPIQWGLILASGVGVGYILWLLSRAESR